MGHASSLRHLKHCVSQLNLSADQLSKIQAIFQSAKPTLEADGQALRADQQKLHTDTANGADKSVLGQDVLNQNADLTKLRSDVSGVRDQVTAALPGDQQSAFSACAQSTGGWGKRVGSGTEE
jgi:hypothetical protein